jgi:hypothetical protein
MVGKNYSHIDDLEQDELFDTPCTTNHLNSVANRVFGKINDKISSYMPSFLENLGKYTKSVGSKIKDKVKFCYACAKETTEEGRISKRKLAAYGILYGLYYGSIIVGGEIARSHTDSLIPHGPHQGGTDVGYHLWLEYLRDVIIPRVQGIFAVLGTIPILIKSVRYYRKKARKE